MFAKELADGSHAVLLLNRGAATATMTFSPRADLASADGSPQHSRLVDATAISARTTFRSRQKCRVMKYACSGIRQLATEREWLLGKLDAPEQVHSMKPVVVTTR